MPRVVSTEHAFEGGKVHLAETLHKRYWRYIYCSEPQCGTSSTFNRDSGGNRDGKGRHHRLWKCRSGGLNSASGVCGKKIGCTQFIKRARMLLSKEQFDVALREAKTVLGTDDATETGALDWLLGSDSTNVLGKRKSSASDLPDEEDKENVDAKAAAAHSPCQGSDIRKRGLGLPLRPADGEPQPTKRTKTVRVLDFGGRIEKTGLEQNPTADDPRVERICVAVPEVPDSQSTPASPLSLGSVKPEPPLTGHTTTRPADTEPERVDLDNVSFWALAQAVHRDLGLLLRSCRRHGDATRGEATYAVPAERKPSTPSAVGLARSFLASGEQSERTLIRKEAKLRGPDFHREWNDALRTCGTPHPKKLDIK